MICYLFGETSTFHYANLHASLEVNDEWQDSQYTAVQNDNACTTQYVQYVQYAQYVQCIHPTILILYLIMYISVASLTYPPSSIPPGIINLGPTYRGYIQPRFNIPPEGIWNLVSIYPLQFQIPPGVY